MTLPSPDEWPRDLEPGRITGDFLRERVKQTPDRTGVIDADTGTSWSFVEFDHRVSDRTERIEHLLTPYESRVGLLLGTRPAFGEVFFSVSRRACSLAPFNVRLDRESLAEQVHRADLDVLVCGESTETMAVDAAPPDVAVASVDEPDRDDVRGLQSDVAASTWPFDAEPHREHLLLFTSGTTGRPKGVRLTRGNLVSSAIASAHRLGVEVDDRWLICLPMYHMGGLAPLIRSTLYGTTTVIQREFDAAATAAVIDEYDVTCLSLVPTQLKRLLDHGWEPPERLRFVLLGGAPAPESLIERCEQRGVPVCPTYGATETASQVATALPETAFDHPGTVGEPLRGTTVSIVGEEGGPCPPGTVGEIFVDGPTVAPGYLDDDQTAAAFGEDGFATGDLGYRDDAGRLWVVGRVDDRIVTGGENVQPATVEAAIRELDGVTDVVVLGLPDEEWGERVSALVESTEDSLTSTDVRAACRDDLADYAVPKTIRVVESLPRTASGTVDRERARTLFSEP